MAMHDSAAAPELLDLHPQTGDLRDAIHAGMRRAQKRLPTLLLYDEHGSKLFDAICELPEYYPTRTELGDHAGLHIDDIAAVARHVRASSDRTGQRQQHEDAHLLLEHLRRTRRLRAGGYLQGPPDGQPATVLAEDYPQVEVLPVCADFNEPFKLPQPRTMPKRNVLYFPGSTIGNLEFAGAHRLLNTMRRLARQGGAVLIGVDLIKDRAVLEAAYNDAQGVTAAFNLNMLTRLNREFEADFDVDAFEHLAVWDADRHRIEMRLISKQKQSVVIDGERFEFTVGEHIITEYSHKYSLEMFANLARNAGFHVEQVWTDADSLFSVQYLVAD
jgi:L-histidine N-alpha-methyltransferase